MKTKITLGLFALFLCGQAVAAVLGRSDADLKKDATHIITGEVIGIASEVEGKRGHQDRIYSIKVRVTKVDKGAGVKKGDEINLAAWTIVSRPAGFAGLQGFDTIPEEGDTITAFCTLEDLKYKPFHPNGIKKH